MNTIVWVLALPLLGLATGKITGAGMAFTRGRTIYDLAAGVLGAVIAGVALRLAGLSGYSAPLPTLLVGVGAAILATWVTRIVTWQPEPILRADDSSNASNEQQTHDVMTTSDGTRLLISARRRHGNDVQMLQAGGAPSRATNTHDIPPPPSSRSIVCTLPSEA